MKMRKILSFVLVLSLVLGSFSMAFAATPATNLSDIAGIANEDAVQVNNDLGIINGFPDGTFKPEQMVTRAEFAAMMTRALAVPESALAGYTSTTFKDTTGYGWAVPYLAFCQSKGIMIGDGFGNAMPGRTINVNEAMTMVLRAIGYVNHSAELVGTWPSNYVTVAQNVGLYDDVAAVLTVDRANAAQIIYNALTVQKVSVNTDGETKFLTLSGTTEPAVLLNTGLNCTVGTEGVLGWDITNDSVINVVAKMGTFGTPYFNDDNEIVAFKVSSTKLEGEVSATDATKFIVDDVKYNLPANAASVVTYKAIENAAKYTTGASLASASSINAKVSGKTITQIYSVEMWTITQHGKVTTGDLEDIKDAELFNEDFVTDNNDDIDVNEFVLVGAASLDKIAKDNIVYVYVGNGDIKKVAVGTEVVTGKVTAKGSDYVVVNGVEYEAATDAGKTTLPGLGKEVTMRLDAYGDVYSFTETGGTATKYGLVVNTDGGNDFDSDRAIVFTSDDAKKTFELVDLDDMKYVDGVSNGGVLAGIPTGGALVGYDLNSDGEISTLDLKATAGSFLVKSTKVVTVGTTDRSISSNVVVFTVSGASYGVTSIANLENNATATAVIMNSDNVVVALTVNKSADTKSADDIYAVLNKTVSILNADDDEVQQITVLVDGVAKTFAGTTALPTLDATTGAALYEITLDGDGNAKNAVAYTGVLANGVTVNSAGVNDDGTVITSGTSKYTVAADAVVYKLTLKDNGDIDKYEASRVGAYNSNDQVWTFDTKATADKDGVATVVIFISK